MHSRVFQIATKPIPKDARITEYDLPDWFVGEIADYAVPTEDLKGDRQWFFDCGRGVLVPNKDKVSFTIAPGGKKEHFKQAYQAFMECMANMSTMTLEAFVGLENGPNGYDADYWMVLLKESYDHRFSFYVYWEDEVISLDEWMRRAEEGVAYYLGGVLDYHS